MDCSVAVTGPSVALKERAADLSELDKAMQVYSCTAIRAYHYACKGKMNPRRFDRFASPFQDFIVGPKLSNIFGSLLRTGVTSDWGTLVVDYDKFTRWKFEQQIDRSCPLASH